MTTPSGYSVQIPTRGRMLMLDQGAAADKAASLSGTVTPLYSIPQIIGALEASDQGDAVDAVLALGLGLLS